MYAGGAGGGTAQGAAGLTADDASALGALHLDLELLRSFATVAEQKTFAAAAVRLGRTQSAVTQQMQRLEEKVGVALFDRRGRSKHLSARGQKLLEYAKQLLLINDEAVRSLRESGIVGSLRVGAPGGIADNILPKILGHIARFAPRVRLEIHVNRSPLLVEELERGTIDLAVSNRYSANLDGIVLHRSPVVWMCSADYVLNYNMPLPLILSDELSLYRQLSVAALEQHRIRWSLAYYSPSLIGIKAALRAGLGITARNVELLSSDLRVLGESDGLPALPSVPYYLWHRPRTVSPLAQQVCEILRASLGGTAVDQVPSANRF